MTIPSKSAILQAIFPDALEVEYIDNKRNCADAYIIKFDPQKFMLTPAHYSYLARLQWTAEKIIYNSETNQMEIHL